MSFKPVWRVSILIVVLIVGAFSGSALAGNEVVAKVGGIPITVYEVERELQKVLPLQVSFHGGISQEKVDAMRAEALEKLIEQAYKVRYALSEELAVDNAAVEERMAPILAKFQSPKEFEEATGQEGASAFRATIYRELLAIKAEELAVESHVSVTDEDVRAYYDENKMTFMRPEQYKASHILIKVDPSSNEKERAEFKEKAEDILRRARAGEDFYNLAYYNSDDRSKYVGGDIGFFHKGQTVKEFEEAIVTMKPGEISDLVQTRWGYHIIKLVEVNPPRLIPFEEARGNIRQSLEKKERDALYADWMNTLKSQYQVQRFAN
jgi:parvulin-like peptidyl-prolyl isomerase